MATKSHFCEAMLSIAARCFGAASSPSNQVTSTLNSLPQYSAACFPCAHHVACSPALEKAAFSGLSDRPATLPISCASAGFMPNAASAAAAPVSESVRNCLRLVMAVPLVSGLAKLSTTVRQEATVVERRQQFSCWRTLHHSACSSWSADGSGQRAARGPVAAGHPRLSLVRASERRGCRPRPSLGAGSASA